MIMGLKLILGPMKSGKSFELIGYFAPLTYTDISFALYQSSKNVRDENIWTRNGMQLEAKKVDNLDEAMDKEYEIIGIDEIHMFDEEVTQDISELLKKDTEVMATGLDMDYKGVLFPVIKKLFELGPEKVTYKKSVCEICKNPEAIYTQIYKDREPVLDSLPSIVPDDGTYAYKPVCRKCFIKKE